MKKFLSIAILMMLALTVSAQHEVIKFLGIPVDGTKAEMIKKLKDKGFTYDSKFDRLQGEFNGRSVYVVVMTEKNKVWRIAILDADTSSESNIKIRFNKLCKQFEKNKKYLSVENYTLSDDEDISYGIMVSKKRYEASYYQLPADPESWNSDDFADGCMNRLVWFMINQERYDKYSISMFYENRYNHSDGEDL